MARASSSPGLLDHRTTEIMSKVPGIANVPILGQLFRSKNFNHAVTSSWSSWLPPRWSIHWGPARSRRPASRSLWFPISTPMTSMPPYSSKSREDGSPRHSRNQPHRKAGGPMTDGSNLPERPSQAIFSVCVDEAVVSAATAAAFKVPGAQFAGEFRDYITSEKRPQFSPSLKNAASCVALIDFDRDPELALETTERLHQIFLKKISIVGVGAQLDAGILLRAVRNGCTEFLTKPVDPNELAAALERFHAVMAVDPHAQSGIGRVIAFFGAKGGVGTTMLAVHLATHLVRQHGKKTLLIDHKPQLGHVALYLGLKDTQYHFDELLRNADRLDSELLERFCRSSPQRPRRHRVAGDVRRPARAQERPTGAGDGLPAPRIRLRAHRLGGALQDSKASIIEQSDEIYIVSTPDVAALRDLARMVENLSLSESATSKLHVVVNRSTATDSITSDQIEKAVRFPISIAVPNNYFELQRAINDGEPIPPQRRSEFNQALARWANRVVHGLSGPKPSPRRRDCSPSCVRKWAPGVSSKMIEVRRCPKYPCT